MFSSLSCNSSLRATTVCSSVVTPPSSRSIIPLANCEQSEVAPICPLRPDLTSLHDSKVKRDRIIIVRGKNWEEFHLNLLFKNEFSFLKNFPYSSSFLEKILINLNNYIGPTDSQKKLSDSNRLEATLKPKLSLFFELILFI